MEKGEILNLVDRTFEQLNKNSELTLNQLYELNGVKSNKTKFEKELIKGVFDTYHSQKLNRVNKKNNE